MIANILLALLQFLMLAFIVRLVIDLIKAKKKHKDCLQQFSEMKEQS